MGHRRERNTQELSPPHSLLVQFSLVPQPCLTLCDSMDCSMSSWRSRVPSCSFLAGEQKTKVLSSIIQWESRSRQRDQCGCYLGQKTILDFMWPWSYLLPTICKKQSLSVLQELWKTKTGSLHQHIKSHTYCIKNMSSGFKTTWQCFYGLNLQYPTWDIWQVNVCLF